jgi:hypothetical protein
VRSTTRWGDVQAEADQLRARFAEDGGAWLSAEQGQALQAIVQCEPVWTAQHDLLDIYDLPKDLHALQWLLSPS